MPRNPQGLYTPPLPPVRAGELIESVWANTTVDDIASALTGSLPRNGTAPMLAPLTLSNIPPTQPRHAVDKAYLDQFLAYATGMPVGAVFAFASASNPAGYLLCNGQAVSRTVYATLFNAIGTTFGSGDEATTFNVPDMRGWFIRGRDPAARLIGSTQQSAFAAHTHPLSDPGHAHAQAAHDHLSHTVGHNHAVTDPGHTHHELATNAPGVGTGNLYVGAGGFDATVGTSQTGIALAPAGDLGTTTSLAQPEIASSITGLSAGVTGETENRPQNIALDYYIKALDDSSQVAAITGITSSDDNIISINSTNPAVPELVIHANVAFGLPQLDASGKISLAQMPFVSSNLLGFFDASSGQNPSQANPSATYFNGDEYIVSVAGTLTVFDPVTLTPTPTLVSVGSTLLYITGSVSSPTGWYSVAAPSSVQASAVGFIPEGTISATNVQAAIAELDSETQAALAGKAPASAATAAGTSFAPSGGVSAATVQLAIQELDTEKAPLDSPALTGNPTAPTPTAGDNDTSIATTEFVQQALSGVAGIPSGAIMDFAMLGAPAGWLVCDGTAVNRTTYATLFSAIGTTWGAGNGTTTFNLPDFRGRFRRMQGTDGVATAGTFATKQGDAIRNITGAVAALYRSGAATITGALGMSAYGSTPAAPGATGADPGDNCTIDIDASREVPTAGENRPYNVAVQTCIKA